MIYGSQIIDGSEECMFLQILRRPGGVVPPAPGEENSKSSAHHFRMNAEQAFLEMGTRLSEKWGGSDKERKIQEEQKLIQSILASAEKLEKEKKANELNADPKAEKK